MSLLTSTNGRMLQPEIPPPSSQLKNPPKPPSLPLTSGPMEPTSQDAHDDSSPKGFWLFKRNSQQRGGSKNASSKRGAVRAPPIERSWSEPNSPTDPTGAGFPGRGKNEDMTDYVSQSKKLLEEYEVRFDGNPSARKLWADLNDRHKQLYTLKREPINNKLVKVNTLKPGAQDAAKSIMEELQAALEKADLFLEEFPDPETIPKGSEVDSKTQVMPQRSSTPDITSKPTSGPWFNPSSLNPAIFDKIDKHKSIHGEGTWHGHSRSRIAAPSRQIPDFTAYVNRNREVVKANETTTHVSREDIRDLKSGYTNQTTDKAVVPRARETGKGNQFDNERDVGKGKERERNDRRDRDRVRDSDKTYDVEGDRYREAGYSRETERSRRDRSRHRRDNIPLIEYSSRPEPTSRERQISDPAVYTQSSHRRDPSPESIAPAVYTLAEDVEVRGGGNSSAETTTGGRNMAETGVPRVPTMLAYPGSTYEEQLAAGFGTMSPRLNHAGPSPRHDRWNPPASAPLAPVAEVPSSSGVPESETTKSHRRRRRSRSLGYELDGKANGERPRSRPPRDRPRGRDYDGDREWDRHRDKGRERDDRERDRERDDRERDRERDKEKDRDREKGKDKERDREKDRERDRPRDKERDREKGKERDKGRDREWDRDRDRDKEHYWEKDRDRDRDRDRDPYGSSRSRYPEEERERQDSGGRRHKDRDRDRDQDKPNDHDREREKDRPREKNKKKDRERDGKDRNRDKDRDRNKDRERREHDYSNPSDRERLASPPTPAARPTTEHSYPSTPMPGAYRDGTIPPGPIPSSGLVPPPNPPPPHTMIKFGVPTTGPYPPNPNSESRFMEILTSPAPPIHFNLPGQM